MSEKIRDDLLDQVLRMKEERDYWRERCARYEGHHAKMEHAAADIKGRVEQFLVVLQMARPQGTEPRA